MLERVVGEADPTRGVPAYRLIGFFFQPFVKLDAVVGDPADGLAHYRMAAQARGVPGGSGGKLRLLAEHDVGPALGGQVVEHTGAHDAATDDDHPDVFGHRKLTSESRRSKKARAAERLQGITSPMPAPPPVITGLFVGTRHR